MGDEHDSWFGPLGVGIKQFASNTVQTVENAITSTVAGGRATSDFRIPEAPPPDPAPPPTFRIPEAPPPEPNQPAQPPAQPSNDGAQGVPIGPPRPPEPPSNADGGGGVTGNSGGAPFSMSGTTPPPQDDSTPRPVPPDDSLLEKFGTVVGGLVDGALEVVKEIPDLIPHGTLPGPVILAPIEKLLKQARGEQDPADGA